MHVAFAVSLTPHFLLVCSVRASGGIRHYVNLTNGLEALDSLSRLVHADELRFTRLQSSHCESGAYDKILAELDHDLLWSLAAGHTCYLYDFASRNPKRGVPRSLFLGIEFVKWALCYLWLGGLDSPHLPAKVLVRGKNLVVFWRDEVIPYKVSKETKTRLRYYTPFAHRSGIERIDLRGVYGRATKIDGKKDAHVSIAHAWLQSNYGSSSTSGQEAATNRERFDTWLQESRFAEFDSAADSDELRRLQAWMVGDAEIRS